jgi:hypothetical protein
LRTKRGLAVAAAAILFLALCFYLHQARLREGAPDRVGDRSPQPQHSYLNRDGHQESIPKPDKTVSSSAPRDGASEVEVERILGSIDWLVYGGAVLDYLKAQEASARDGKKPQYSDGTIQALATVNVKLEQLAEWLGIRDPREIRFHEKVWPLYASGWMKALGVQLSPVQELKLRESACAFSRARDREQNEALDSNRLEKLAWQAEQGLRWDQEVRQLLTPEQFAQYAKPAGTDPFWGLQASRREVRMGRLDETARSVERFWQAAFGVEEPVQPILAQAASDYVREVDRHLATYRASGQAESGRDALQKLHVDLLRLQIKAEQELGRKLGQRQGAADQSSGTMLRWTWE